MSEDIEASRRDGKLAEVLEPLSQKGKLLAGKIFPFMRKKSAEEESSRREFVDKIKQFREQELFNDDTASMMEALLSLGKTQVRDIMVPRAQMTIIKENWNLDKVMEVILESRHSRYPVFDEEKEEVVGVLITKDLLPLLIDKDDNNLDFKKILRPVTLVPESKTIETMLREFKLKRHHMAVVIDEYGSVSGLLTIEDAIEEIVGEIDDEHDRVPDAPVRKLNARIFWIKALMPISEFNAYFNSDLSDAEADTVGGYVLHKFGRMPTNGESIDISDTMRITVSKANPRRIFTLKLQIKKSEKLTNPADSDLAATESNSLSMVD